MKTILTKFTIKDLNKIAPGFYNIYAKNFSVINKLNLSLPIQYTEIKKISDEDSESFISGFENKLPSSKKLDLSNPKVMCVRTADIELEPKDKYGQIILISKTGGRVKYGEKGIAPSEDSPPLDLLHKNLDIPAKSFGVLDIEKHVPFLIEVKNTFALPVCELERVYEHEENITRYSLDLTYQLKPENAKRLTISIQEKIFNDKKMNIFMKKSRQKFTNQLNII